MNPIKEEKGMILNSPEKIVPWAIRKNILSNIVETFFIGNMMAKLVDEDGQMYLVDMRTLEMVRISAA